MGMWAQYLPVSRLSTPPATWCGFLSPKFESKPALTHQAVCNFTRGTLDNTHAFTFSPQVDMGSLFLNVFEQNDLFDPGFVAVAVTVADAYPEAIGHPMSTASMVMDSRQLVLLNFIVARPASENLG